jgi:DNA polymerase-3 subunit gamma/tau
MRGFITIWIATAAVLGGCERDRPRSSEAESAPLVLPKAEAAAEVAEPTPALGTASRIQDRLLADPLLSPAARRVTIIVENGIVTLRGQVATEQERSRVDRIATDVAGNAMVRDELEVMSTSERTVVTGGPEREPMTTGEREPRSSGEREPASTPPMATTPSGDTRVPMPYAPIVIVVPSGGGPATVLPPGTVLPGDAPVSPAPGATSGTVPSTARPGLTAPGEPAQQAPGTPGTVPGTTAPAPSGISPGTTTPGPSTRPATPPPPPATPAPAGGGR